MIGFNWYLLLIISYFLLFFCYLQFGDKNDIKNNFLAFGALFFVFIHLLIFMALMYQDPASRSNITEMWELILGIPILVIGAIVGVSSVAVILFKVVFGPKDFSDLKTRSQKKMNDMEKTRRDTYRKISHVLIFIGLFIVWYLGVDVVKSSGERWVDMCPEDNNMLNMYFSLLSERNVIKDIILSLGWLYTLFFTFFYSFCLLLLINEITRKTKCFRFPFNLLPELVMSEEEIESYGTYLYFAIGQMFAAFICPPMVYFAILGMSGIGDLMTSQIGIRFGKKNIFWNKKKTWEGTIAGTITSFLVCYMFVGWLWSLIFALAFMCIDLFTNKPLKVSDNLLIPIGCSILFVLLRYYLDFTYVSRILEFVL
ncbi:MAG: diacylglycerol/polyprenol kinase family protein [Promethearchaeia archaeon]